MLHISDAFFWGSPFFLVCDHGLRYREVSQVAGRAGQRGVLVHPGHQLVHVGRGRFRLFQKLFPRIVQEQGGVSGILIPDVFGNCVGTAMQRYDEEPDVTLPVGRLRREQLHVRSQQRVDEDIPTLKAEERSSTCSADFIISQGISIFFLICDLMSLIVA